MAAYGPQTWDHMSYILLMAYTNPSRFYKADNVHPQMSAALEQLLLELKYSYLAIELNKNIQVGLSYFENHPAIIILGELPTRPRCGPVSVNRS